MARLRFSITTEGEVALAGATAKTVLQVAAPANQRVAVRSFGVSFDGISGSAEPVLVELLRQTTAGTMSACTEVVEDDSLPETVQAVGQRAASVEPTAGSVIRSYEVHPQSGIERVFGPDEEIIVKGGGRLGLRLTAPAAVNAAAFFSLEE